MYYCSKCAIQLIQQGFKVQDIEDNCVQPSNNSRFESGAFTKFDVSSLFKRIVDVNDKLSTKYDRLKSAKDSFVQQYQKDLNQVDAYYDSLISTIEELRVKDR
jgi:hypothetical protein